MHSPSERAFAANADARSWRSSPLHDPARDWPQTNCYVDLWIEALHARGMQPEAMLGFTATLDFEGDQFTFFKPPLEDIETLYGFAVRELALYDDTANHIAEQVARARLVMIEADAFFLPDTRGVSYGLEHSKTTIGVNRIDPAARTIDYFHNDGFFRAHGADYDGLIAFGAENGRQTLPPYAEIVKADFSGLAPDALRRTARAQFARHLARMPQRNPVEAFAHRLSWLMDRIGAREPEFFHKFAFNTLRQLGANFELMSSFLTYVGEGDEFAREVETCKVISAGAKSFQFLLARAIMRRKAVGLDAPLAALCEAHDALSSGLAQRDGMVRLAS